MRNRIGPLIIGIAGGSGSGKTTIANVILSRTGAEYVSILAHDSYYKDLSHLSTDERIKINFDHPDSLDTAFLIEHLTKLKCGNPIAVPIYDFKSHTRTKQTIRMLPKPVILVEGILIFTEKKLRDQFDIKIFVDTDADLRFIRRLQRDIAERGRSRDSVVYQYLATVRPMHLEFVEPSKRYADVIVPEGGENTVALDMIVARIQTMLNNEKKQNFTT